MKLFLHQPKMFNSNKITVILAILLMGGGGKGWGQTNNYFGASGSLNSNVWSTNVAGPYTSPLNTSGGAIINFGNTATFNGETIVVAGINATADATIGSNNGTISNFNNSIITIDVSSGKTLDFGSQMFTASATAGYIKNNAGALALAGNKYGGGFTLNNGTLIARGVNAMGGNAVNPGALVINGGIIAANANRDFSVKYNGITIGGNFTLGAITPPASSAANLTFSNIMDLGNGTTRIITIGGSGAYTFGGVIKGAGSALTIINTSTGTLVLAGANTYSGLTTASGGTVQLNRTGGTTIPATNSVAINGGILRISTDQTINDLTLSSGTLQIDAGITLTITGIYNVTGGIINCLGTIKLNGGLVSFPGSGVTVNNGTVNTITNLEIAAIDDVSLSASLIVSGALTLTSGKLSIGPNTLTLSGSVTRTLGKLDGNSSSVLTLGGGSAQDLAFSNISSLSILNVNKTGGIATLNSNATDSLDLYSGIVFTGNTGILDLNGKIVVLRSTATKTAYMGKLAGTLNGASNITVERYIPLGSITTLRTGKAWRLLTAPVTGTTIKAAWQEGNNWDGVMPVQLPSTGYGTLITGLQQVNATTANGHGFDFWSAIFNSYSSIRTHSGSGAGSWLTPGSISGVNIESNQGYLLYVRGDRSVSTAATGQATTLRATGILNQGTKTPTVIAHAISTYTLIGNPYASPIDFEKIYQANASLIEDRFTAWDANLNTTGGYVLVQRVDPTHYDITPSGGSTTSSTTAQHIQSGQAFFVEAKTAGGLLSIQEAFKSTLGNDAIFLKNDNLVAEGLVTKSRTVVSSININLSIKNANNDLLLADGALVSFSNKYTHAVTTEDVPKASNFLENIAIAVDTFKLISERRQLLAKKDTVYLKLWGTNIKNYQFTITAAGFTLPGATAQLIDRYLNIATPLILDGSSTTINFSVTSETASRSIDRFYIVMPSKIGTDINATFAQENAAIVLKPGNGVMGAFPNPGNGSKITLTLNDLLKGKYEIAVYNNNGIKMLGRKVDHLGGKFVENIGLVNLSNGMYSILLLDKKGNKIKKVAVVLNR